MLSWASMLAGMGLLGGVLAGRLNGGAPTMAPFGESLLLGLALVVSARLNVEIRHRGEVVAMDIFEVALTPALFLLPGMEVVLLVALAEVITQLWLRMPWTKLVFNVAQWTACAGIGALVFAALAPADPHRSRIPALIVAMAAVAAANPAAMAVLFGLLSGAEEVRRLLLSRDLLRTTAVTGVTVTVGLGIAGLALYHPLAAALAIALPVLLHQLSHAYALARADLDRLKRLQVATHMLSTAIDLQRGVEAYLPEVAACCRAQAAELVLLGSDQREPERYLVPSSTPGPTSRGDAVPDTSELTGLLLDQELPLHVVAEPRGAPPRFLPRWLPPSHRRAAGWAGRWPLRVGPALLWPLRGLRGSLRLPGRWWSGGWPGDPLPRPRRQTRTGAVARSRPSRECADAVRATGWRDCLAVPILVGTEQVGLLAVYDRSGFAVLDPADLVTLEALAREVSAAVQRSRLIGEIVGVRNNAARIVQASNDGIVALAEDGAVVTWNPALATLTGWPAQEMLGHGGLARLDAQRENGTAVKLEGWASEGPLPSDFGIRTRDGRRRWLSCSFARTTPEGLTGPLLVIMVRDVTELRRQRDLIAGQSRVLTLVASDHPVESSLRAILDLLNRQLDATPSLLLADSAPWRRFAVLHRDGERPAEALPEPLVAALEAVPTSRWAEAAATARPLVLTWPVGSPERGKAARTRTCWALPVLDGATAPPRCLLVARPAGSADPDQHAVTVLRTAADLAGVALERDRARKSLAHQATHDPLTGLPNRVLFLDRCAQALEKGRRGAGHAAVLFIDLDRFKVVNDSLGHEAGDRLLVAVASRLRGTIRPSDTIARFGGDEFTILCEDLPSADEARVLAERLLGVFESPFTQQGRDVFESASVGITLGRAPQRAEDLIQQADAAMYRAKAAGGNRYDFFDARLREEAETRLARYTGLRRAVDGGEIVVHYQPTVALRDGSPVGVEALARWRHPGQGVLSPDTFIDLAEQTGLIVPLGRQILRTALRELPAEPPRGCQQPLRISVNLSARQLVHRDLLPTVEAALEDANVPPARLSLEITESVLLTDSAAMRAAIANLKRIGVDLSLDDFGTGHSSMDYLRFLPVDELKIERRFIAGLLTQRQDSAIVSAITHLAHDLDLRVVAEGVETAEQADHLRAIGCDIGQGYFFGAPMPAHEVLNLTRAHPEPVRTPRNGVRRLRADEAGPAPDPDGD